MKKKRKKSLPKKPAANVGDEGPAPEVEEPSGIPEVGAEAPAKKKKRRSQKGKKKEEAEADLAEEPEHPAEIAAEDAPVEKPKKKKKKPQLVPAEDVEKSAAVQKPKKKQQAVPKGKAKASAPATVDEDLKDEMVALLAKWHNKEYNRAEETYHSSDGFGDAISFTVYWSRPAVGIKIWDYEEEEWSQKAYFAKYSLPLCIFMARKFAEKLVLNGLDWSNSDEGIAYRNVLKATALAAEEAQ